MLYYITVRISFSSLLGKFYSKTSTADDSNGYQGRSNDVLFYIHKYINSIKNH